MAPSDPKEPPISYDDSSVWSDITPIPLSDAPELPGTSLAAINYPAHYSEAMSYLRAVMAKNELSERALELTDDIISINPAHYTVWLYRARIVTELEERGGKKIPLEDRLKDELMWMEEQATQNLKNYQIWHHRQLIVAKLQSPPSNENAFLDRILSLDTKNHHVWTYRQWMVRHFSLWDSPSEMASVESFINRDVRNNSAWNHRWFLNFGRDELESEATDGRANQEPKIIDLDLLDKEISYAKQRIILAPQNASPWTYLRALVRKTAAVGSTTLSDLQEFAERFIGTPSKAIGVGLQRENVKSTYALDWVAECYVEQGKATEAKQIWLGSLAGKWDPIRKGYWEYRAGQVVDTKG